MSLVRTLPKIVIRAAVTCLPKTHEAKVHKRNFKETGMKPINVDSILNLSPVLSSVSGPEP